LEKPLVSRVFRRIPIRIVRFDRSTVVWLLESNGAIASRGVLDSARIDALSALRPNERPWVFLGADKSSAARSRFDAAHELAHILLHQDVTEANLSNPVEWKQVESQADRFASAFLLPAEGFAADMARPTLDAMRIMKTRWRVSIAAMIMRARDLDIVSDEGARRLSMSRARRGWSRQEPLDETTPAEEPVLFRKAFSLVLDLPSVGSAQVLADLPYSPNDIESLARLPSGWLANASPINLALRPPRPDRSNPPDAPGEVVAFRRPD
jgi:Zn-dependent peptidase ImmA (M78 family)